MQNLKKQFLDIGEPLNPNHGSVDSSLKPSPLGTWDSTYVASVLTITKLMATYSNFLWTLCRPVLSPWQARCLDSNTLEHLSNTDG